jgi:hypothetical protein
VTSQSDGDEGTGPRATTILAATTLATVCCKRLQRNALGVHAAAGERSGAATRREGDRVRELQPTPQSEGETRGEAVSRPVGVCHGALRPSRGERAARARPSPEAPGRRDHDARAGIQVALVPLCLVLPAPHERVELYTRSA